MPNASSLAYVTIALLLHTKLCPVEACIIKFHVMLISSLYLHDLYLMIYFGNIVSGFALSEVYYNYATSSNKKKK